MAQNDRSDEANPYMTAFNGYFQMWEQMTRGHMERLQNIQSRMTQPGYDHSALARDAFECWSTSVGDAWKLWCGPLAHAPATSSDEVCFHVAPLDENSSLSHGFLVPPVPAGSIPHSTPLQRDGGGADISADKVFLNLESTKILAVQIINLRPPPKTEAEMPAHPTPTGTYRGRVVLGSRTLTKVVVHVH